MLSNFPAGACDDGCKTPRDTLVIADGFSCRQQIKDGGDRWAMHPAEVLALALESRGAVPAEIPERRAHAR